MGAIETLLRLSGKKHAALTRRGDQAILLALRAAKQLGLTAIVIADQGGWISYPSLAKRAGLGVKTLRTDHGIIGPDVLSKAVNAETGLLVCSMAGYFAEQPVGLLMGICRQKNSLLINDCSGTIGTELAKIGDLIVCSFGDDKPVNLGTGGFIAWDHPSVQKVMADADFETSKAPALEEKLAALPARLRRFGKVRSALFDELSDLDIIHKRLNGINLVVRFSNLAERERIIKAAARHDLPWEECPADHKVLAQAISLEVKRIP